MKPIPCIASGERTSIPNRTPHQVKANIPSTISAASSTACDGVRCGFQPSARPKPTTITMPSTCSQNWPITWPLMIDRRLIGIERKRSMTPSVMSLEVADPGADHPEGQRLADDPREQVVLVADPGTWMAEPNTYRNSRMKTIGWIVTSSRRSGTRGIARRLRPVSSSVSRAKPSGPAGMPAPANGDGRWRRWRSYRGLLEFEGRLVGGVPGQRQERVVERRTAQRDLVDGDPRLVDRGGDAGEIRRLVAAPGSRSSAARQRA